MLNMILNNLFVGIKLELIILQNRINFQFRPIIYFRLNN